MWLQHCQSATWSVIALGTPITHMVFMARMGCSGECQVTAVRFLWWYAERYAWLGLRP
jgi:hypothetical protein